MTPSAFGRDSGHGRAATEERTLCGQSAVSYQIDRTNSR